MRPLVPLRSRQNTFSRQLYSVVSFEQSIPELLPNFYSSREGVLAPFSRLTVPTMAIPKLSSLRNWEDDLRMLSRMARESFNGLPFHVYDEVVEGLEKPIGSEEKEVPDTEHLSNLDLALTALELLDEAMSKNALYMLNEAPLSKARKA
ncbi:hypothetical protein KC343_g733 [Hortaea werneckii]|nr:hypothetical protein KC352_g4501 [Hortaea werneckii]KAI7572429.1 hypothetical protein KC317_g765 [Hortaea werneckii]KAI7627506.1 hypothetical protein KC346_g718 [Hortaea werneckii]KAI7637397.1 hypothetical protein KC343_g733 [Hortaea werneckii]KAI7683098.1 hypothetical protein KC319_g635 [Hortaea werneckii]